ncbi:MAG: shikimate kinase [Evtepia gabavorous]
MHNVILIGMPGVGKSTLGVLLAKTLGMTFLDTDLVIQDQKKALLRELIAQHGIDGFLALEGSVRCGLQAEKRRSPPAAAWFMSRRAMSTSGKSVPSST